MEVRSFWNLSVSSRNWHLLMPKIKITYLRKSELQCAWHFNKSYSNDQQPTTLLFDLVGTYAASHVPSAMSDVLLPQLTCESILTTFGSSSPRNNCNKTLWSHAILYSVICHGWWPLRPYANFQFQQWVCIIRLAFIFCKVKCFWKHHSYTCFVIQGQFECCTRHDECIKNQRETNSTSLQNNLFWPRAVRMHCHLFLSGLFRYWLVQIWQARLLAVISCLRFEKMWETTCFMRHKLKCEWLCFTEILAPRTQSASWRWKSHKIVFGERNVFL